MTLHTAPFDADLINSVAWLPCFAQISTFFAYNSIWAPSGLSLYMFHKENVQEGVAFIELVTDCFHSTSASM